MLNLMTNTAKLLPAWTDYAGHNLHQVHQMLPVNAGIFVDQERTNFLEQFDRIFANIDPKDVLFAPLRDSAKSLLDQLPVRGNTFEDHKKIIRIFYAIGRKAEEVQMLLRRTAIADTSESFINLQARDRVSADAGDGAAPGPMAAVLREFSQAVLGTQDQINMHKATRRLKMGRGRVFTQEADKKEIHRAFYTMETQDPGKKPDAIEQVQIGNLVVRLNKHALGIREQVVQLAGWGPNVIRSGPVAIAKEVLRNPDPVILPVDYKKNIPYV